jgi:hypothetical protein
MSKIPKGRSDDKELDHGVRELFPEGRFPTLLVQAVDHVYGDKTSERERLLNLEIKEKNHRGDQCQKGGHRRKACKYPFSGSE